MDNARQAGAADLERVVDTFNALMHRLMATHSPELNTIELTMSQAKALYLAIATGPLRMSAFANRLGVTNSTATGLVDRLVELRLLERHEDPADRRQVVVTATAEAAEVVERFRELNTRRMREMLAEIDADDLATVEHALHILDAAIPAHPGEAATIPAATTATAFTEGDRS